MTVFATNDVLRRWFVVFRGASMPHGILALILWEVDPATG
jgi:hypothetical protein